MPGSPLYQCEMTLVSENGAELMVHDPLAMPDRFDLLFSPIAQSWRECAIVARRYEAKSVRILFLGRHLPLYSSQTQCLLSEEVDLRCGSICHVT